MRRISFLTSSFPRFPDDPTVGYLYQLTRALAQALPGEVEVIVPADRRRHEFFGEDGVEIRPFRYFFPRRLQRLAYGSGMPDNLRIGILPRLQILFLLFSFLIAGYKSAKKSDLIYAHWMVPAGLVGAILARCLGKKMILTIHSGGLHLLRRWPGGRKLAAFICSESSGVTVTCAQQKKFLLELLPEGVRSSVSPLICISPMGIERETYQGGFDKDYLKNQYRISTRFTVIFMGRLVAVKGLPVLLNALQGRKDVTLLVLGDGKERAAVENQGRELGIQARFTGFVNNQKKIDYLHISDIMIQPSVILPGGRTEGVPVSLLEGMAAGLPVIASRVGGIPDIIADGEDGFLVDPDDPGSLRERIDRLLEDPVLRKEMGEKAAMRAGAYDWKNIMPGIVSLFTAEPQRAQRKRENIVKTIPLL